MSGYLWVARYGVAYVEIATGYNGTPRGFPRCNEHERGCHRCADSASYPQGTSYDVCICVHAEQNAVLQAAKLGYSADGSTCWRTTD